MPCLITHLQRGVPRHAELLMCSVVYRAIPDYSRAGWRATSPSTANHNAKVATRFVPQVSSGRQVVADVGDAGHTRVTNGCMHTCMQGGGGGACWCHQWLHACMHAWGGDHVGVNNGCMHACMHGEGVHVAVNNGCMHACMHACMGWGPCWLHPMAAGRLQTYIHYDYIRFDVRLTCHMDRATQRTTQRTTQHYPAEYPAYYPSIICWNLLLRTPWHTL